MQAAKRLLPKLHTTPPSVDIFIRIKLFNGWSDLNNFWHVIIKTKSHLHFYNIFRNVGARE